MNKLKVLDLFSGIGGFSLGLERTGGFETVAFCEIEDYPRKVLAKHWPNVPIHKDIRELQADAVGHIDLICGGYPCQPFSLAGNRRGKEDDRHLWPEVARLMDAIRPTWGLFENVAGHINMGLDEVLSELEGQGYTAWTLVIPACAVDAPHRRDRVWIVAHTGHGAGRYGFGGSLGEMANGQMTRGSGHQRQLRLQDQVRHQKLWPTPIADDAKNITPNPKRFAGQLYAAVYQGPESGSLNPTWVEWLMGFPEGWTDLKD